MIPLHLQTVPKWKVALQFVFSRGQEGDFLAKPQVPAPRASSNGEMPCMTQEQTIWILFGVWWETERAEENISFRLKLTLSWDGYRNAEKRVILAQHCILCQADDSYEGQIWEKSWRRSFWMSYDNKKFRFLPLKVILFLKKVLHSSYFSYPYQHILYLCFLSLPSQVAKFCWENMPNVTSRLKVSVKRS